MRGEYKTTPLHVDINFVDNDILNIEFHLKIGEKNIRIEFVLNDEGKYICGNEIEKMSKSKYNVQTPEIW